MSTLLIIGASHGIGRALLEKELDNRKCINISRTSANLQHPNLEEILMDVLSDELPELTDIGSIVYCPGSINLKPISSLKEEAQRPMETANCVNPSASPTSHLFADDGTIPNNPTLPLLVYERALVLDQGDGAAICEALLAANGWGSSWRNGIYSFHHYHSTAHEVLAHRGGRARRAR